MRDQVGPLSTVATDHNIAQDEKEVLEGVMEWFGQRLQRLDKLEYYQERRLRRLGLLDDDGSSTFEDMVQINV